MSLLVDTCRTCGARLFDGLTHCARCYTPVAPTNEELEQAAVELAAAQGGWQAPKAPTGRRPDQPDPQPRIEKVHSRRRSSALSFSLPTKIAISLAVTLGAPLLAWMIASALAMGPIAVWSITVTPRVLRDLWRRTRVA